MKTNTLDYLNQSLIEAIELSKVTGTNAVDFVKEQAPDVVNQLISWNLINNIVMAVVLVAIAACVVILMKKRILGHIVGLIIIVVILMPALSYAMSAIKIVVAPKVWLLEYAASLLK